MKKLSLSLLVILATLTFSSFKPIDPRSHVAHKAVATPPGTAIGTQYDGSTYYYSFYADLSGTSPWPLTYIQVQRASDGVILTTSSFSGTVIYWIFHQYQINGTATVQFYDGSTLVTKSLTGGIDGGV
jgi:hypothetical protein